MVLALRDRAVRTGSGRWRVSVRFVGALERTASGKLRKHAIRAALLLVS